MKERKIGKNKLTGIMLLVLLLVYTAASSSVNAMAPAQSPEDVTISEDRLGAVTADAKPALAVTAEETSTAVLMPLVQPMTQAPASVSALYQEAAYDSFFEHTVFVGDSLTVGFANYCKKHSDSLATDTTYFLAKESCSAKIALSGKALTEYADVMPSYNGQVRYIEDSLSEMSDIEKVFICFGMNDLVVSTPSEYVDSMETLIERILAKSPQVSIYVISIPCVVDSVQTGLLSNSSIAQANSLMQTACEDKGWGFVNLSEYLMASDLAICEKYSGDGYVHENSAAYAVWVKVLRNYAYKDMTL